VTIFTYAILGLIFAFLGQSNASFGMMAAIILSGWFLCSHKVDIKEQMNKIEQMRELEDRIIEEIKQQEILEAKLKNHG
jgi:hypothetical protein